MANISNQEDIDERWEYINNDLHRQLPNDLSDKSEWLKLSKETIESIMVMLNQFMIEYPNHFGAEIWIKKINENYFTSFDSNLLEGKSEPAIIHSSLNLSIEKKSKNIETPHESRILNNNNKRSINEYFISNNSKKFNNQSKQGNINYDSITAPEHMLQQTLKPYNLSPASMIDSIENDPGLRKPISLLYGQNKEDVIDAYICKGPYQPKLESYPINNTKRRFKSNWFDKFEWLEYSPSQDKAFCFPCYLFSLKSDESKFVNIGFNNWNKALDKSKGFHKHIGNHESNHKLCVDKMNQRENKEAHLQSKFLRLHQEQESVHIKRLTLSINSCIFLALQGLAFRGHDESEESYNRGNFLEILSFIANNNEEFSNIIKNSPQNAKYTSPDIQKDIIHAASETILKEIDTEISTKYYSILADEARCYAKKEWMSCIVRYVGDDGRIVERFIDLVHVKDTKSKTLYDNLMQILKNHSLDPKRIRGQGYDGANNMRGEDKGLKALVLESTPSAYYIHCFAHRLNLIIVKACKENMEIANFFVTMELLYNTIGSSCKNSDKLRDEEAKNIKKQLENNEYETGSRKIQQYSLKHLSDTRWECRYSACVALQRMFKSAVNVLDSINEDAKNPEKRLQSSNISETINSFGFVFSLLLMSKLLAIFNVLSKSLQRKNTDLVTAVALINSSKTNLTAIRSSYFDNLIQSCVTFCTINSIEIPDLTRPLPEKGKRLRCRPSDKYTKVYLDYLKCDVFEVIIDLIYQEFNKRFNEKSVELISYASAFTPSNNFKNFNIDYLMTLSRFYPDDFREGDLSDLEAELSTILGYWMMHKDYKSLCSLEDLSVAMVMSGGNKCYPWTYRLLTLVLTLPVATASNERSFSAAKIIKTRLRTSIGDKWFRDLLVIYIEKELSKKLDIKSVISYFNKMKVRRL